MYSIKNIKRSEAGCYSCEADNGFSSTPASKEVTVIVQCKSLSVILHGQENVWLVFNKNQSANKPYLLNQLIAIYCFVNKIDEITAYENRKFPNIIFEFTYLFIHF